MVPLSSAVRMVLKGTIRDAKTISSVLWLDHQVANHHSLHSSQRTIQAPHQGKKTATKRSA